MDDGVYIFLFTIRGACEKCRNSGTWKVSSMPLLP